MGAAAFFLPSSCGGESAPLAVRTANGFINAIDGTLQNLDSIRTPRVDLTADYRSPERGIGSFGVSLNAMRLLKYVLSASNGFVVIDRKNTECGSPDQAFPKYNGNAALD
ncbi:hypothetical protein Q5H91_07035 [Sphingomonas sp. KR1UV-12]|uniref:Uncharacterized protein n=1 Tax=Sphingomonas aurea TaxID=3063994 RepID=A0ABT9EJE8_9SPHN|nr:hypothetical protein [Sphingomonas sp. KR1UV-12]MDP1026960.1 hypothetical protein [Sphingomonas sp. KR1UV-12]